MGIEVEGIEELLFQIRQGGSKALRNATKQMRIEAEAMQSLAQAMAPVDDGDLEGSILVQESTDRDEKGRFATKTFTIGVDIERMTERGDARIGDYTYIMHEYLEPYGPYKLGKRSLAKQATSGNVQVGGMYLERAAMEIQAGLIGRIAAKVREVF